MSVCPLKVAELLVEFSPSEYKTDTTLSRLRARAASSATVSALALIVLYANDLSFAQCGINPQNMREIRFGLWLVITGFICPGLTFQRGLRSWTK